MKPHTVIVKVGKSQFLKYRNVRNLVKFAEFLDNNFPDWRYINVFDKFTKEQVANYTKKNRPR